MARVVKTTAAESTVPEASRRNRRDDVMAAAIEVFWRNGYSGASVQHVADQVGVLKGSLYHYIDSKEDLLFWILEDVHERSHHILNEVMELDIEPLERLRTYIERHVEWYLENVEEVTVFFRDWSYVSGERLELVTQRRRGYAKIIRDLIAEAQARGDVDAGVDPKYASFFLLAAVNHVPDWYHKDQSDKPADIAAIYADFVFGALVGTKPRKARGRKPRKPAAKPAKAASTTARRRSAAAKSG